MGSETTAWPQPPEDEGELVRRMRAGEETAFEMFAERYIPGLYRFARRRLNQDRELTQEIVQTTLCKVIEKLDTFRGEAPLFTWLYACCRNEIAAHYRRKGRRPREVELAFDDDGGQVLAGALSGRPVDEAGEAIGRAETSELVHLALDRLPPAHARALEWRYVDGFDVVEIARRLEVSYKAAESLLSRARQAFRKAYETLAVGPGNLRVPASHTEGGAVL